MIFCKPYVSPLVHLKYNSPLINLLDCPTLNLIDFSNESARLQRTLENDLMRHPQAYIGTRGGFD